MLTGNLSISLPHKVLLGYRTQLGIIELLGTAVVLYTIPGGKHAWPGGFAAWPGGDEPTKQISATLMGEFFKEHPKIAN